MVTKKILRNTLTAVLVGSTLLCACTKEETYSLHEENEDKGTENVGISDDSNPFSEDAYDLTGSWHLDSSWNNLSEFPDLFDCYAEFGASMEISRSGQISWYIGAEGGEGTFKVEGSILTASISRTVDQSRVTTEFDILRDGDEVYLGMHWTNGIVFWNWSDDDSANLSGEEHPVATGKNVVKLVNLQEDETTVYQLDDGRYMDRTNKVFIFDGVETWKDENGVEWNEKI